MYTRCGLGAHQRHRAAVLRDRADRGADVRAGEEEVEPDHDEHGEPKAMSRANETNMPATSRVGSVSRTERWSVVHRNVASDWMKKSRPPVARSWFTGGLFRIGVMIRRCTPIAEQDAERDAGGGAEQERPAVDLHREVDEVHAQHREIDVDDPHDVEHAEDQVEPEGEQREHAAEQEAVQRRLREQQRVVEEEIDEAAHSPT